MLAHMNSSNSRGSPENQNAWTGISIHFTAGKLRLREVVIVQNYNKLNARDGVWTRVWLTPMCSTKEAVPPPTPFQAHSCDPECHWEGRACGPEERLAVRCPAPEDVGEEQGPLAGSQLSFPRVSSAPSSVHILCAGSRPLQPHSGSGSWTLLQPLLV